MDSDAGMYTLTQCITGSPVDHPSIHGSPKGGYTAQPTSYMAPALPISWCGGGETHITTLGADSPAVCTEASVHVSSYEQMHNQHHHSHHEMHDENNTVVYLGDPYGNSYNHHPDRVSSACHKIESYSMVGGSHHCGNTPDEDLRHFNNNNNTCDYNKELENQQSQPIRKYPRRNVVTRGRVSKNKQTVSSDKETTSPKKSSAESSEEETSDSNNVSNYDNVMVWLNHQACGGTVKRKRRITKTQRVAANQRERKRMVHLNSAFECLRETIPSFPYEKKLSRIQTLKLAIDYIGFMTEILYGKESAANHSYYSGSESPEMNRDLHYW